jgi:hypothetical protein
MKGSKSMRRVAIVVAGATLASGVLVGGSALAATPAHPATLATSVQGGGWDRGPHKGDRWDAKNHRWQRWDSDSRSWCTWDGHAWKRNHNKHQEHWDGHNHRWTR